MKLHTSPNHFSSPLRYIIAALLLCCTTDAHAQLDWCDTFAQDRLIIDENQDTYIENFVVAVSGDTAVIGARLSNNEKYDAAVYVFVQTRDQWNLQATIYPPEVNSDFGFSVAISGDTIVIGAPYVRLNHNRGAAYVYTRTDDVWTQQAILDGSFENDYFAFGMSVAIDDDTIIVGVDDSCTEDYCTGVAHIFTRANNEWAHAAMLTPQDRDNSNLFARTVAISGNTAVVSSIDGFQDVINIPLASVYTFTDGVWIFESTLIPNDIHDVDYEVSLAIEDDTIVVGSTQYEIPDSNSDGAALIFTRTNQTWTHEASLSNYDKNISREQFGFAVDIDQGRVLVSPENGFTDESDPVVLFSNSDGVWNETISFAPSSTNEYYERFGSSISLSGDHIIVGFYYADDMINSQPFALDLYCDTTCYADLQENGILDFYDFSIFRNAFISNDPLADFYADGEIDLFDLFAYMIAFNRGCYIPPEPLQNPN